jgi:hypothetical protein
LRPIQNRQVSFLVKPKSSWHERVSTFVTIGSFCESPTIRAQLCKQLRNSKRRQQLVLCPLALAQEKVNHAAARFRATPCRTCDLASLGEHSIVCFFLHQITLLSRTRGSMWFVGWSVIHPVRFSVQGTVEATLQPLYFALYSKMIHVLPISYLLTVKWKLSRTELYDITSNPDERCRRGKLLLQTCRCGP